MLSIGQIVKMKNRKMLPEHFKNKGEVIKLHDKDKRICWVEFTHALDDLGYMEISTTLNLHEIELEDYDE